MKLVVGLTAGLLALASFATDYYVDANYGNDAWDGSTPEIPTQATIDAGGVIPGPRQTLQAGVDLAKKSGDVVHAAPGVYDKGETWDGYNSNRVSMAVAGVGLVADKGKGVTFIEGRFHGKDTPCGPAAVRGVRITVANTYVKNFTIRNGSTGATTASDHNYDGGAVYGSNKGAVIDCVVTNCAAGFRGGIAFATLINCKVYPQVSGAYGVYDCSAYNCVFPDKVTVYGNGTLLNSTFLGAGPTGRSANQPVYNCYFEVCNKNLNCYHCAYVGNPNAGSTYENCLPTTKIEANIDPATFYPREGSSLIDTGSDADYESKYAAAYKETFASYDFAFSPRKKGAAIDIGACEYDWSDEFAKILSNTNAFFSVSDVAPTAFLQDATSVVLPVGAFLNGAWKNPSGEAMPSTVSFTAVVSDSAVLKVYLNGAAEPTWTLTAADGERTVAYLSKTADTLRFVVEGSGGAAVLSAFSSTAHRCLFVDAVNGTNTNDGTSLATARKTLAAVMALNPLEGDIIYAADGVYGEGEMWDGANSNRIVISKAIGLESLNGASHAVIEGYADPRGEDEGVTNGCGALAVRGANISNGAWIRGFTFRNCHTTVRVSNTGNGGGCYCDGDSAVVDCVFTNCYAGYRGGGTRMGSAIRCLYVDCHSTYDGTGPAAFATSGFNCLFKECSSYDVCKMVNCTFRGCAPRGRGTGGCKVFNTLIDQADGGNDVLYRCQTGGNGGKGGSSYEDGTLVNQAVLEMVDAETCVPKYGSKPVDFGDVNHYVTNFPSAFTRFMWLDCRGAPRVSNGKIDCGAFEYDWRGDFAARMKRTGRYQLVVESASPDVTTNALGQVTLTDGTSLSAVWTVGQDDQMSFCVPVTGAGVVTVTVDGQAVTPEAETGFCQLDVAAGKHTIEIAFAGAGSATAHTFSLSQTGVLLIVR